MVAPPTDRGTRTRSVVLTGIALNTLAAVASGGMHLLGEPPPLRVVAWPGGLAVAGAYAVPAVLAAMALRSQRPAALLGAGLAGVPLAFTAMSGVSLILIVPAACYLIGYAAWTPRRRLGASAAAGIVITVVAGTAALLLPFAAPTIRPQGYCYSWTEDFAGHRAYSQARLDDPGDLMQSSEPGSDVRAAGGGCASDVVTLTEAALGLGAAVIALGVSRWLPRSAAATVANAPG